jgi:hypothetical protein
MRIDASACAIACHVIHTQVVQKDAIPYDKQTGNLQTGVQFKLTDPSDVQPSVSLLSQ